MFNYVECRSCGKTNTIQADSVSAKCESCDAVILNSVTDMLLQDDVMNLWASNTLVRKQSIVRIDINGDYNGI